MEANGDEKDVGGEEEEVEENKKVNRPTCSPLTHARALYVKVMHIYMHNWLTCGIE